MKMKTNRYDSVSNKYTLTSFIWFKLLEKKWKYYNFIGTRNAIFGIILIQLYHPLLGTSYYRVSCWQIKCQLQVNEIKIYIPLWKCDKEIASHIFWHSFPYDFFCFTQGLKRIDEYISQFQYKRSQRADIFIDSMKEKLPKYLRLFFIALKTTYQAHVFGGTEEYWRQVHFSLVWLMQLYI